jgi:hypothetical protein
MLLPATRFQNTETVATSTCFVGQYFNNPYWRLISHSRFGLEQCRLCNDSSASGIYAGLDEVVAGWKMMTSRHAVPAACTLGEVKANIPPFTSPR